MSARRLPLWMAIVAVALAGSAAAEWDVDGIEELLPHAETAAERQRWEGREHWMPQRGTDADPPPVPPVRNCAEWEAATGVLIRYPLGLPYALLRDLDDNVTLHVLVSAGLHASAQTNLAAQGVDMGRVEFLIEPNDSIWTRDYGPWFVFDGNDDLTVIDHVYNRPFRPNDNLIPLKLAAQLGLPAVSHDMWHTGGNYMTDGAHVSSSTELVYHEAAAENGMSEAEVDQLMSDYYGISDYEVLGYIESGGIHHIDTWAKFLDEETVLVKEVWSTHHTYNTLEARATLLASLIASTGRPYQVHRVYCHNIGGGPASYTNSLILNDVVYVPTFSNATHDANALAVYAQALPGYDVRGYNHSGWLTDDALHCRTKAVMDAGMLRVAHVPVLDPQAGPVEITAEVRDYSGAGVSVVTLHTRSDGGVWQALPMAWTGGDTYRATIPAPAVSATTDYYIHAESASGREAGMPRVEPAHWYSFAHDPGTTALANPATVAERAPATATPNPLRTSTTFRFELRDADHVALAVYDASGRLVRRLVDGRRSGGAHAVDWDARDQSGARVGAGVYYFRLRAVGLEYTRPVTVLP